jgi:putative transposase
MFSFFSFKEKLKEKSRRYEKKVIIVDESYTSCTCGVCGHINNAKGNEVFKCSSCNLVLDRDVQGSRNIFIKNNPTLRVM